LRGAPQRVDLVLEDQAPSVSGIVMDGDKPLGDAKIQIVKWPAATTNVSGTVTGPDGRFQISSLEPGDYRIFALSPNFVLRVTTPGALTRPLSIGESITLHRSENKSITLKSTDPTR